MSKGSQGGGYVVSTYHREFSESKFIQASAAIGNSNFFALKGGRKLSKYSNINGTMTFQNWDVSVPPMLEATYECALGKEECLKINLFRRRYERGLDL